MNTWHVERGSSEFVRWINDRLGRTIFVDESLFYLVRYCGLSLSSARAVITKVLESNLDVIACSQTSEGVMQGGNLCGTEGLARCLEWSALNIEGTRGGWTTHFQLDKVILGMPPGVRSHKRKAITEVALHRVTFYANHINTLIAIDMARYLEAETEMTDYQHITFVRKHRFAPYEIARALSFGWLVVEELPDATTQPSP